MHQVYVGGVLVAPREPCSNHPKQKDSRSLGEDEYQGTAPAAAIEAQNRVRVIDIVPGGVVADRVEAFVKVEKGCGFMIPTRMIKLAVGRRHKGLGTSDSG